MLTHRTCGKNGSEDQNEIGAAVAAMDKMRGHYEKDFNRLICSMFGIDL